MNQWGKDFHSKKKKNINFLLDKILRLVRREEIFPSNRLITIKVRWEGIVRCGYTFRARDIS